MTALEKRLTALEQRNHSDGPNVVIKFEVNATEEDHVRGMAEAEAVAGPHGRIICVQYDTVKRPDWWGPEQDEIMRQSDLKWAHLPPYTIRTSDQRTWGPGD
ncbi:MAG: hypothetical protein H0X37_22440 [Herpetosiphonaceae bacterium]|nr:hypothetical protein [Herpetosiphonaceae bacterium]